MEIRSTNGYKGQLLLGGILLGLLDVVILINEGVCWFSIGMLLISLAFALFALLLCVAYGRTFLFDENGCTVVFGKYRKHYAWRDLKVIQYEGSQRALHYARTEARPDTRLVFLQKTAKPPRRIGIESYCIFFHPLSCIFVGFLKSEQKAGSRLDKIYIAPGEEFQMRLKQWGVDYTI